ncbi:DNA repair protein RecN [Prochlorococcus sp. MIT 1300]|uniref:DNA repair protein RecN n=1 Tax=Prochlorococcus sp. MIT 1300 TaxID=3096218 RepID=UPI002A7621AA|nr:DNA repair protein RecN [Prochlorococcus sp. MIT 1300]
MLTVLRLQNIALIESLELSFEKGFSVLTGETGAGKSILLDALDALLGGAYGPLGSRLLRSGAQKGLIEGSFSLTSHVENFLIQKGFEVENKEITISREFRYKDSKLTTRFRLNGILINRNQILSIRPFLIDLTIQGQSQKLDSPTRQRDWLDLFGGQPLLLALDDTKKAWNIWKSANQKLLNAQVKLDETQVKREENLILLDELEAAELEDPSEDQNLAKEQDKLAHGVRLGEGINYLIQRLNDSEDRIPSAMDHLSMASHELKALSKLDSTLSVVYSQSMDLSNDLYDLIANLQNYIQSLESEPGRLDQIQARIDFLNRLKRRHSMDLKGILELRDCLRTQLYDENINKLVFKLEEEEAEYKNLRNKCNNNLSVLREQAAREFEMQLLNYLKPMGLSNLRFQIKLTSISPCEKGADEIQFLFSANPGQPLAPLTEVASGGEMSRFLLALKTTLSSIDMPGTFLFDEIDAGVSGRVSSSIANLLKQLARSQQVFCVTHQPLIAAAADHHFSVNKTVHKGITYSSVVELIDFQDRKNELAELAGGDIAQARNYAASLLDQQAA